MEEVEAKGNVTQRSKSTIQTKNLVVDAITTSLLVRLSTYTLQYIRKAANELRKMVIDRFNYTNYTIYSLWVRIRYSICENVFYDFRCC